MRGLKNRYPSGLMFEYIQYLCGYPMEQENVCPPLFAIRKNLFVICPIAKRFCLYPESIYFSFFAKLPRSGSNLTPYQWSGSEIVFLMQDTV